MRRIMNNFPMAERPHLATARLGRIETPRAPAPETVEGELIKPSKLLV
jgi:hypothetical protein